MLPESAARNIELPLIEEVLGDVTLQHTPEAQVIDHCSKLTIPGERSTEQQQACLPSGTEIVGE
jgi:hypothetical protein